MSPVTEPSLRISTRSPTMRSPSILPMTTTSRAETVAMITPLRPTVTRLSGMLMVPSMRPSTYNVSAPETSPLITMERPIVACSGEVVKVLVALVGPNAGVGAEPAGVENLSLGCSMIVSPSAGFGICRCARHKSRETIVINIPEIAGGGQITEDGVRRKEPRNFLKSREEGVALEPEETCLELRHPTLRLPNLSPKSATSQLRAQSHRASHSRGHAPDRKPHRASTRSNSIDLPRRRRST